MQVKDRLVKNAGFNKDPTKWTDDQWTVFSRALTDVKAQQQAFTANKQGRAADAGRREEVDRRPLAKVKVVGSRAPLGRQAGARRGRRAARVPGQAGRLRHPVERAGSSSTAAQDVKMPRQRRQPAALYRRRHGF
jgi:hypothetical protein